MLKHSRLHTGAAYEFTLAPGYTGEVKYPAVVLIAGWSSDSFSSTYNELARTLREIGYHTLQLSLRGHEGSDGDLRAVTQVEHVEDIHAAFEWLAERPEVDIDRLGVVAASYGAYNVARLAPQLQSVKLMALRAPALYPDIVSTNQPVVAMVEDPGRSEWRSKIRGLSESSALKGIAEFSGDLLIVWSGNDEYLPPQVLQSYTSAATHADQKVHAIMDAGHVLDENGKEEFIKITKEFFRERFPKT